MVKMYPVSNKMICFYQLFFFLPLLSLIIFVDKASASSNILLIVVDNLRPALSSYTNVEAKTPNMDSIGYGGTTFARAYCQIPWCSPSRNSFLTGRYPNETKAYNFVDSFREKNVGDDWITMPEYFKKNKYYTTSVGKIFHPKLPPKFDFPNSWTDYPYFPVKPLCPNDTMSCAFNNVSSNFSDVDYLTYIEATKRIDYFKKNSTSNNNFFLAVGFQSPRLPWSYPDAVAKNFYKNSSNIQVAQNLNATTKSRLEWVSKFYFFPKPKKDIHPLTHITFHTLRSTVSSNRNRYVFKY